MKRILGLDLGTNSIGWALVDADQKQILGMGSRIIPMTQDVLDIFSGGKPLETQTAARTSYRSVRRLRERTLLRRERLHRVLNVLDFLPEHYAQEIDFIKHFGQFIDEKEPKIAWRKNEETGKFEFLFQQSFLEMVKDFKAHGQNIKIPYDWTIYYLRKEALKRKIKKEELAWLLLNFNQKRGYYQLRGEEEEKTDVKEYCQLLKIISVEKGEQDKKNTQKHWYKITFENGWDYSATFTSDPNWLNTEKEFLITEEFDENGNIKIVKDKKSDTNGKEKRRITPLPSFDEINLMSKEQQNKIYKKIKARTEITITNSNKTVGAYIYETLLQNPTQKICGKLVRTIERKYYKDELIAILNKQIELQPELFTEQLYSDCVRELYRSNTDRQTILSSKDFLHLFVNDILFYQRPLRSQKSAIGNCTLEYRIHKDKEGKEVKEYLKSVPKSNLYYQEFRVWQWLSNLKIYKKEDDSDVTAQFIKNDDDKVALFDFLMTKKEVGHKDILAYFFEKESKKGKVANIEIAKYRWNYVFDDSKEKEEDKSKKYPCNTTDYEIRRRLKEVPNVPDDFLSIIDKKEVEIKKKNEKTGKREKTGEKIVVSLDTREYQLWHIIYSVTDKKEYEIALKNYATKYNLDVDSFVDNFKKFPPFKSEYGSFSEKAIKKLLPLMRLGKYWDFDNIDEKSKERIEKLQTGEFDEKIKDRVREKVNKEKLDKNEDYQGLPLWLASYVAYSRHSEAKNTDQWLYSYDIQRYLYDFKQHDLRNPIVEQVVTETLRTIKDVWEYYAKKNKIPYILVYDEHKKKEVKSYPKFFEEIHVELGREMKNTAEDRKYFSNVVSENENTNLRIKALLMELQNDSEIENVRPHSPMQQDILRIYEEYALQNNEKYAGTDNNGNDVFVSEEIPDDIKSISKKSEPTKSELTRYKLWLEQKYRSPYTGQMIPLGRLFTEDYQIEHIIPKSRYFDDSFNNKVICESEVNQLKDKLLAFEFIKEHHGEKVPLNFGKSVTIFTEEQYKDFVKEHYAKNNAKRSNLLLDEIPEKMITRQMNDTRYISKFICGLLSNIVRTEKDDDGINSKYLIPCNGKITTTLKQDWGLNEVWNSLILPRFERMNELTQTENFTSKNQEGHTIPAMPFELQKGFQKKRIDHRHHAMDALVIACATRDHINLLNNQHAKSDNSRYDLQHKLRNMEKWTDKDGKERDVFKDFKKPWDNFIIDAKKELDKIVVSFKQNLRVINKATNKYEKFKDGKKTEVKQEGTNWAIRKPLHKETVYAKVDLPSVKVPKGKIITASRTNLDTSFDEKKIKTITDTGIQKILTNYLLSKDNKPEIAFSPEGIEDLNKNISLFNNGKKHQPILKVRTFEIGSRFALGTTGNKKDKYVEAAKGTNLFFAVYADEDDKRSFETIPLNIVIERLKQGLNEVPETNEKGNKLSFHLSPNDLVYVPTEDEKVNGIVNFENIDVKRIYKMVSSSGNQCMFIRHDVATAIVNKSEFSPLNKMERAITGEMIKDVCIKLKVDRLGNITKAGGGL